MNLHDKLTGLRNEPGSTTFEAMQRMNGRHAFIDAHFDAILTALSATEWEGIETAFDTVWRQARENHVNYSATGDKETDLRFFALGLAGEAGELANFVKKRWRDGDGHDQSIRYEIADVCAYAFMAADCMGMTPADLIATVAEKQVAFIAKMQARPLPTPPEGIET